MDKHVLFGVIPARQIKWFRLCTINLNEQYEQNSQEKNYFIELKGSQVFPHIPVDKAIAIAHIEPFHSSLHQSSCNSRTVVRTYTYEKELWNTVNNKSLNSWGMKYQRA